jgi:hypothetical protein
MVRARVAVAPGTLDESRQSAESHVPRFAKMIRCPALVAALSLAATSAARAQDPPAGPYTGSVFLADAAAVGALGLAGIVATNKPHGTYSTYVFFTDLSVALVAAGSAGYLFGGPAVHWWHERQSRAAGSFGLRLGIPIAAAVLGAGIGASAYHESPGCGCQVIGAISGAVVGAGAGALIAMVLDWAWLARRDEAQPRATAVFAGTFVAARARF